MEWKWTTTNIFSSSSREQDTSACGAKAEEPILLLHQLVACSSLKA